jgi:hypothetical protein
MPRYEYRDVRPSREAEEVYLRWIKYLDEEFTKHRKPELRAELVHDNLHQLMLGQPKGGRLNFTLTSELPFNVLTSRWSRNTTAISTRRGMPALSR